MRGIGIVCVLAGAVFGVIGFVVMKILHIEDALLLAVVCGGLFGAMMYLALNIYGKVLDHRYHKLEKSIHSPVFHKTLGNFQFPNQKARTGMVYFCQDEIRFVFAEEKPYTQDSLSWDELDYISCGPVQLQFITKSGRRIVVNMSDTETTVTALRENGRL